jgi:glycine dehydrogenase subunit 2
MTNFMAASPGLEIHEPVIFERSEPGVSGVDFNIKTNIALPDFINNLKRNTDDELTFPELSEPDAVRHYTRLSRKNFAIDISSYPLGSCTMKYNPKIHEWAARLLGLSSLHPYMPINLLTPALEIYWQLQNFLSEIGGFHRTSLAPSAGAHGEFAGIAMICKALKDRGEKRHKILVPKSAHGTNPATAAFFSYDVIPLDVGPGGRIIVAQVQELMTTDCAGIMITNPNTLGIFESDIKQVAEIIHQRGGYVYGDGANLNAMMGITRPGDWGVDVMHFNLHKTMTTPHGGGGPGCGALGASAELAPYLPVPYVKKENNNFTFINNTPQSIGRIRSFFGNFAMIIRAWLYVLSLGPTGLKRASQLAVLNTNYIRAKLSPYYHQPFATDCLHEVILSDARQSAFGVTTLDIAKRLIDYGIHPPTIYFPLVVKNAMMIEPTETESLYDLDQLIQAFISVAIEARESPELVKSAPHHTALSRLDETKAARQPVLVWHDSQL